MTDDPYVKVQASITTRTAKAVRLWLYTCGGTREMWVPRSCLHANSDLLLDAHENGPTKHWFEIRYWFFTKNKIDVEPPASLTDPDNAEHEGNEYDV